MKPVTTNVKYALSLVSMKINLLIIIFMILAALCFSYYVGSLKVTRFDDFMSGEL